MNTIIITTKQGDMTIDERASRSMSLSPSPRFGLNWQMEFLTELCSELNHGVVFGVGGHMECWGDGMCSEMRGRDIPSERVVEKSVPLHARHVFLSCVSP